MLRSLLANAIMECTDNHSPRPAEVKRQFVCATCKSEIQSGRSIHFMKDHCFCSNLCRMTWCQTPLDPPYAFAQAKEEAQYGASFFKTFLTSVKKSFELSSDE